MSALLVLTAIGGQDGLDNGAGNTAVSDDDDDDDGEVDSTEDDTELDAIDLCPITLDDIYAVVAESHGAEHGELVEWSKRDHFVVTSPATSVVSKRKRLLTPRSEHSLWKRALEKVDSMPDVWNNFDVGGTLTEKALRHRYNAASAIWTTDEVFVKMESRHFNEGAMRHCFRAKKLSNFSHKESWLRESNNFVAKCYKSAVTRAVYYEDVRLQMEAKLWGEEYNRHDPPKKVDIVQMCVIEMVDRPDRPLFHLEHFIEGQYVKYNSNSGFVRDEQLRLTPQAFSHFTFERSGHELIVVDIQGVGDLYTDPQIHTADGECYGDGNLGTRGMALFFHSHVCSAICRQLSLTQFDLASSESCQLRPQAQQQALCKTVWRNSGDESSAHSNSAASVSRSRHVSNNHDTSNQHAVTRRHSSECWSSDEPTSPSLSHGVDDLSESMIEAVRLKRSRFVSETSTASSDSFTDRARFSEAIQNKQRASHVDAEVCRLLQSAQPRLPVTPDGQETQISAVTSQSSVLGQIHFDLAKYHEIGRFVSVDQRRIEDGDIECGNTVRYDRRAAKFHLECALQCRHLDATLLMADICLDRPHDLLTHVQADVERDTVLRGVQLLQSAAEVGHKQSALDLARCYELGTYVNEARGSDARDWKLSLHWYKVALSSAYTADNEGCCDSGGVASFSSAAIIGGDDALHSLLGHCAHMYMTGGPNLAPDLATAADMFSEAAEAAAAAMKGRAASKFFMLAEQCSAEAAGD